MNLNMKVAGAQELQEALSAMNRSTAKAAITLWSNWVGIEAQSEMRRQLPGRFKFRGTSEGFRKAVVFEAAKQSGIRKLKAELRVGGQELGQSRTDKLGVILARHEDADTRSRSAGTGLADLVRFSGGRISATGGYFLPANGLRTDSRNPSRNLYPRQIGVQMREDRNGSIGFADSTRGKGRHRVSFFATERGIFRRSATRAAGTRQVQAIWWFRRVVRTPARLGLWTTANTVFQERSVSLGAQAVEEAIFRKFLSDKKKGAPKSLF